MPAVATAYLIPDGLHPSRYMQLDLTPDCKVYDKYKRKFMGAVHAAILDTGSGSIMPAYLQDTLMQSIESIKVRPRTPAVHQSPPSYYLTLCASTSRAHSTKPRALLLEQPPSMRTPVCMPEACKNGQS